MSGTKIRRIFFLEPRGEKLHVFSRYVLPRLGTLLLATIMRDHGYEARSLFLSRREILARNLDADLVAISIITPTAEVAYELADHFRRRGLPVVIGDPHVTYRPAGFSLWELQKAQIAAHARFFSPPRVVQTLLRGRFKAFAAGLYAHTVMRRWLRWEQEYLKRLRSSFSMVSGRPAKGSSGAG